MSRYSTYSDDFYVNVNLNTEMELPSSRETLLHYFEQVQKKYPTMRNFYARDRAEYVLEEEKEQGHYRWTTVESRRICAGHVNPSSLEEAMELHRSIMKLVPYSLSVSSLDCESLNVMIGFDFTYRGNHNQLVAEALGLAPAFERLMEIPGANVVAFEPSIQVALDDDCRIQCRLSVETRTSAFHVKTGDFPEEQLSVYVTARRYGSFDPGEDLSATVDRLGKLCCDIVDDHVVDHVLRPLQQAIALRCSSAVRRVNLGSLGLQPDTSPRRSTGSTSPRRSTGSRVIRQHKVAAGVTGGDEGTEVDRLRLIDFRLIGFRLASWPPSRRSPRRADGGRTRPPADLAMQASHPRRATPALRERGYATEETGLRRSDENSKKLQTKNSRRSIKESSRPATRCPSHHLLRICRKSPRKRDLTPFCAERLGRRRGTAGGSGKTQATRRLRTALPNGSRRPLLRRAQPIPSPRQPSLHLTLTRSQPLPPNFPLTRTYRAT